MAFGLLGLSALATLLYLPLTQSLSTAHGQYAALAGIGLIFLSVIRGALLIGGLFAAAGAGQGFLLAIAAVVMEIVSCGLHFMAMDARTSAPHYIAFEAGATLLPAILIAAGVLTVTGHHLAVPVALAGALLPLLVGAAGFAAAKSLDAQMLERRAAEDREWEAHAARQRAALDAVPAEAGVSALLPFTGEAYAPVIQSEAIARILKTPGARAQLESLPDPLAKKLLHRAVQNERLAEIAAIPESAGLDPLLRFAAPGEDPELISAARDRVRQRKDGENELRAALRGGKKLTALGVLASYDWHGINEETVAQAFTAIRVATRELDARMASADPPSKAELDALCSAAGIFVGRYEDIAKRHEADLRKLKSIGGCAQLTLPDL